MLLSTISSAKGEVSVMMTLMLLRAMRSSQRMEQVLIEGKVRPEHVSHACRVPEDPRKSNGSQHQSMGTDAQQEPEKDDVSVGR